MLRWQYKLKHQGDCMESIAVRARMIARELSKMYDDPIMCDQYSWWILETILDQSEAELLAHDYTLAEDQEGVLQEWLHKLIDDKMPLAYLIGSVPFAGATILIYPPVLIPRPETEEWTINLIERFNKLKNKKLTILDLCTGSGCIAVALAREFHDTHIYASDISDDALACAQKNIVHNEVDNVVLIKSDLFADLPRDIRYDLIVGNPPYINPEQWDTLSDQVTAWEDKNALVADNKGLPIISDIIKEAPRYLKENKEMQEKRVPQLELEIDSMQGVEAQYMMEQNAFCDVKVEKDLEGKDRVICGRFAPCGHYHE